MMKIKKRKHLVMLGYILLCVIIWQIYKNNYREEIKERSLYDIIYSDKNNK